MKLWPCLFLAALFSTAIDAKAEVRLVPYKKKTVHRKVADIADIAAAKLVYRDFILCQKLNDPKQQDASVEAIRRCTENHVGSKVSESKKRKLQEFLFLPLTISELFVCSKKQEADFRIFGPKKGLLLCFEIYGNQKTAHGYMAFEKEDDHMVIFDMNFSVASLI